MRCNVSYKHVINKLYLLKYIHAWNISAKETCFIRVFYSVVFGNNRVVLNELVRTTKYIVKVKIKVLTGQKVNMTIFGRVRAQKRVCGRKTKWYALAEKKGVVVSCR